MKSISSATNDKKMPTDAQAKYHIGQIEYGKQILGQFEYFVQHDIVSNEILCNKVVKKSTINPFLGIDMLIMHS